VRSLGPADLTGEWESVRKRLLWAGGLRDLDESSGVRPGEGYTGHAFNDWPMYAERWFPEGAFELTPLYRNIYDNSGLCQFCHRSAAYFTVAGAGAVAYAANSGAAAAALPLTCRRFAAALGFAALAQASMGVATLMLYVPIPLAAAHQAGSVVVWTCALGVVRSLRFLPK
jgi:cytochrome c oxidase assembly protein subunit 15